MGPYQIARNSGSFFFFCMGGIFSAIWFFCRTDSESIFILLVLLSYVFF